MVEFNAADIAIDVSKEITEPLSLTKKFWYPTLVSFLWDAPSRTHLSSESAHSRNNHAIYLTLQFTIINLQATYLVVGIIPVRKYYRSVSFFHGRSKFS